MVTSLPNAVSVHRLRRDQRHAGLHRRLAQARLHHAFRFRKLCLGVDAAHLVLAGLDHDRLPSLLADDLDRVRQIIFAFGIRVADLVQDRKRTAAVDRHHTGVAQVDLALRFAGVGLLADRNQAVAFDDEAAITGRIGRAKAERRDRSALGERRAQPRERAGRDQRRIAEGNEEIIHPARNRIARREHRMRGPEPLGLHEGERVRADPPRLVRHGLMIGPDHDGERGAGSPGCRRQHMSKQALVSDRMQHLRQARSHARAFAGGEHDREAGTGGHRNPVRWSRIAWREAQRPSDATATPANARNSSAVRFSC